MRLSWVRALPPRLWGGPGAPQVARGLCQRPARDPSEGVTPTPGTSDPPRPQGRVPNSRGDTLRGDPSGGGTSRGDASRGGSSRGDPSRGGTSKGDTLKGDTSRSDTFGGDASRGGSSWGDPSGGDTPKTPSPPASSHKTHHDHHHDHHHHHHREDPRDGDPPGSGSPPRGDPAAFAAALGGAAAGTAPGRGGGRVALVEAALAAMPALGVERDPRAYNALLRLLPRGTWVPRGPVQRLLFPFPRQQECGLRLLEQMEQYGVMPDAETRFLLLGVFGPRSRPVRKLQRMMYWLPRFRHINPHPLPPTVPPPGVAAARMGLHRIANDPDARVTVLQAPVPDTGGDEGSVQPYIVSSQSPEQKELLAQHGPSRPVFVEGPFPLWLRRTRLSYFVLRGDPLPPHLRDPPLDPERSFYFPLELELDLERGPWDDDDFDVDEVEEGPVFALCVAGAGDRHTLGRWISALQEENPVLGSTPVIFRLSQGGPHPPGPPEGSQPPRLGTGTPPGAELEPPEGKGGEGEKGGDPPKNSGE